MSVCAEWAFQSAKPGGTAGKIKVYLLKIQVFIDLVPAVCLGQDFFITKLHILTLILKNAKEITQ